LLKGKDIEFQAFIRSDAEQQFKPSEKCISLKKILGKALEGDYSQYILLTDSILSTLMLAPPTETEVCMHKVIP